MAVRTPYTPLYGDVLDYLERSGLPSVGGIFDDYDESKNPFIIDFEESTSSDDLDKTDTPLAQATRGGGGDFSVYNPDPTRTRTSDEYSPYAYRQAAERNLIGSGDSQFDINKYGTGFRSETEAQKFMDMYPEYYRGKQLTGIPGAAANYLQNSLVGRGIASLEDMLPVNTRAILENEALGAGIALDDIGRIVQGSGDYDSAANVMAGYNLNKLTPETIQKRRETIEKTMNKPGYSGNLQERLDALDDFERQMFGTTGVKNRADMITEQRLMEEDPSLAGPDYLRNSFNFYGPSFLKQEQQKAIETAIATEQKRVAEEKKIAEEKEKARQQELDRRKTDSDNDGVPDYVEDSGGSYEGGYHGSEGGFENTGGGGGSGGGGGGYHGGGADMGGGSPGSQGPGGSDEMGSFAKGGRVKYLYGGLTSL